MWPNPIILLSPKVYVPKIPAVRQPDQDHVVVIAFDRPGQAIAIRDFYDATRMVQAVLVELIIWYGTVVQGHGSRFVINSYEVASL